MEKIENHCPLSSTSHEGLTLPLLASVTWCFSADFAKPLALIQMLLNGRGFIGYPKGRNRDIKLVN